MFEVGRMSERCVQNSNKLMHSLMSEYSTHLDRLSSVVTETQVEQLAGRTPQFDASLSPGTLYHNNACSPINREDSVQEITATKNTDAATCL